MTPEAYFILLLAANLTSSITLAIIAPFFPPYAKSRGIQEDLVGLIFSAHPLGASLAAYFVGKNLTKKNSKTIMSLGLLIQAIAMFLFAALELIDNRAGAITLAVLARFLNGMGSAMFFTPFYATVPELFPNSVEQKIAISAFVNSLGYMVGPVVGSFLYSIGGFVGPFAFFGGLSVLISGILKLNNRSQRRSKAQPSEEEMEKQKVEEIVQTNNVRYMDALLKYEIFVLVCITFICNVLYTYYHPIIANYFDEEFGISPEEVGYYMIGGATGYCSAAFLIYLVPMNKKFKILYLLNGLIITSFAQFFYGPDSFTGLTPEWYISVAAQTVCGFTVLFPYVLQLPYLNKYLRAYFFLNEGSTRMASALFNIAAACGELTGPLASGVLVELVGFKRTATILGCSILFTGLLALPLVRRELRQKRNSDGITILMSLLNEK